MNEVTQERSQSRRTAFLKYQKREEMNNNDKTQWYTCNNSHADKEEMQQRNCLGIVSRKTAVWGAGWGRGDGEESGA